jgi:hypothetical protein
MPRGGWILLGLVTLGALGAGTLWPVLARDEQFAFRDAAHYFYPLHLRIQREWDAGRLPLWLPDENAGAPLLGNPTAAVLYPGKVVFGMLPYPRAARAYILLHLAIAATAMACLARGLSVSPPGTILASASYAFGAPVLGLYANVIYLVGAAWLPLGALAVDRLVRGGSPRAAVGLGAVLALQVLGGDPQAAYVTAMAGGLYAIGLSAAGPPGRLGRGRLALGLAGLVFLWIGAVVLAAWRAAGTGTGAAMAFPAASSSGRWRLLVWGAVVVAAGVAWGYGRHREGVRRLGSRLGRLALACGIAGLLAAVQIVPALEVARGSFRAAEGTTFGMYRFSLEPLRLIEALWPNVTGAPLPENRSWLTLGDAPGGPDFWTPSLYLGGATVLLAMAAVGRGGPGPRAPRVGLLALAILGIGCGMGSHGGPLGSIRRVPALAAVLGPRDTPDTAEGRPDGTLPDAAGSPYALLAAAAPGFGSFRFPAKLLTPAAMAMAALAGMGWDRLRAGEGRVARAGGVLLAATGLASWAVVTIRREAIVAAWSAAPQRPALGGPLDAAGAVADLRRGLIHGSVATLAVLLLARLAVRRPGVAGGLLAVVVAIDLAVANAGIVWTAPQALFDAPSEAARRIAADAGAGSGADADGGASGPFRVFRMPPWQPSDWSARRSRDRIAELAAWDRDTLQPSWGLARGVSFALSAGVLEDEDYLWFYRTQVRPLSPANAAGLGAPAARRVRYHPRRGINLWGARYFVLPIRTDGWIGESRGYAALLPRSTLIYPLRADIPAAADQARWRDRQDWQVYRNDAAFPRAWAVHQARVIPPATAAERPRVMERLLFQGDALWSDPGRPVFDPRTTALVEGDDPRRLVGALDRPPPGAPETVVVRDVTPTRVEVDATLAGRGLVVLADAFAPGWRLEIDGEPAPILRVHRLMRGALVASGRHRLVYTYEPLAPRLGAAGTLAGLVLAGIVLLRRPPARTMSPDADDAPTLTEAPPWAPANRSSTPPTSGSASPGTASTTSSAPPRRG